MTDTSNPNGRRNLGTTPEVARRGKKAERVHAAVTRAERGKVRRVARRLKTSESSLLFVNSVQDILQYHDEVYKRKAPAIAD